MEYFTIQKVIENPLPYMIIYAAVVFIVLALAIFIGRGGRPYGR